jgi:hypothetical protein
MDDGWVPSTTGTPSRPPAQYMNWLQKWTYDWLNYVKNIEAEQLVWTVLQRFNLSLHAFSGAGSNASAIEGTGDGSGAGGSFTGGAGAPGAFGTVPAGSEHPGLHGRGGTSASGSSPLGVWAQGVDGGRGLWVSSNSNAIDVADVDGHINLAGGDNPAYNAGAEPDRLTRKNLVKAWGSAKIESGVLTILDGYNVSNIAIETALSGGHTIFVTLSVGMSAVNYGIVITSNGGLGDEVFQAVRSDETHLEVIAYRAGTQLDFNEGATNTAFTFMVMGAQDAS